MEFPSYTLGVKISALLLLAAGALLTGCASSPILRAASNGQNEEVTALLGQGSSIEDTAITGCGTYPPGFQARAGKETPLICAAINGQAKTVRLLLEKGANVNAQDFVGNTALSYASMGMTANRAVAELLRAKLEGRPLDSPADPPPVAEPQAKPAVAGKQWWEK
jgi:hypothetical protein